MKLRFQENETRVRFFSGPHPRLPVGGRGRRTFLVCDENAPLPKALQRLPTFPLKGGEGSKTWRTLESVLAWLAELNAERGDTLLVLGGGAVLDLGALAAALYRRGMPLTLVPTTLLGMVDASLGGKTAVNFRGPRGLVKNFAGLFYPAQEVWVCPHFLASLPRRERLSGAGECWKTLWIAGARGNDEGLLEYVNGGADGTALLPLIRRCLAEKIRVVEKDPLDQLRVRELLNYGHTVGHALESLARGRIPHGLCVLWGMAAESQVGGGAEMRAETMRVLKALGLPLPKEFSLPAARWLRALGTDKKMARGSLELSVLRAPGRVKKLRLTPARLAAAVRAFPEFYRP